MGFGGIDSDSDRADLIAFLDTLKDAPAAPASPVPPSPSPLAAEHVVAGDAAAGKATAQQMCAMCHSFDKDGPVMMGPPLYGVVGRAPASVAGFAYSDGIKTIGGVWSADRLDHWITDPRAMVAETRMAFPGVPSAADRANIVAFLATLHDRAAP
ncbi:c-type cytochrome [Ameyamaea chiangmaiensis]|nr:c-type cytochrome [Ameyamaea chiangmaiensis]